MSDVVIGNGNFRGRGVYANRTFKKGEVVVRYKLKELTTKDFRKLPKEEQAFVHSFWGKPYLFSGESRYVNHSSKPSTYQDLELMADVAAIDIQEGGAVTTSGTKEIENELTTFLEAYEKAANSCDFSNVDPLIADDAEFVFTNGTFRGRQAIRKAFEETWVKIKDEKYLISDVRWTKRGYRNAVCEYTFRSDGVVNGKRQIYEGSGENTLTRIDGNWRIVREHLSKAP